MQSLIDFLAYRHWSRRTLHTLCTSTPCTHFMGGKDFLVVMVFLKRCQQCFALASFTFTYILTKQKPATYFAVVTIYIFVLSMFHNSQSLIISFRFCFMNRLNITLDGSTGLSSKETFERCNPPIQLIAQLLFLEELLTIRHDIFVGSFRSFRRCLCNPFGLL